MWRGTNPQLGSLKGLAEAYSTADPFENAQPMTVRLRGVKVAEDYDGVLRGTNDLMIVTKFQLGDEPPVERLHFMEKDVGLGWHDDFFHSVVYSTPDYSGKRLTVQLRVYDVDTVDEGLIGSVRQLSEQAAGLFPQLAPYLGVVTFAVGPVVELVNNIDEHDEILNDQITVEPPRENRAGIKLLKPGYLVCSRDTIEQNATLGDDLRIQLPGSGEETDGSYAVFGVVRNNLVDRQYEINQRAAKLVAELKGKGQSDNTSIHFLQETLDAYGKFQKLERARDLQRRDTLSDAQHHLLDDLKSDPELAPYLDGD
jgi:hypothetical protein